MPVFLDLTYLAHDKLLVHNRPLVQLFSEACQSFTNGQSRVTRNMKPTRGGIYRYLIYLRDRALPLSGYQSVRRRLLPRTSRGIRSGNQRSRARILLVCTLTSGRLDRDRFQPVQFHSVISGSRSIYHSSQWLLAGLYKYVDILTKKSRGWLVVRCEGHLFAERDRTGDFDDN